MSGLGDSVDVCESSDSEEDDAPLIRLAGKEIYSGEFALRWVAATVVAGEAFWTLKIGFGASCSGSITASFSFLGVFGTFGYSTGFTASIFLTFDSLADSSFFDQRPLRSLCILLTDRIEL